MDDRTFIPVSLLQLMAKVLAAAGQLADAEQQKTTGMQIQITFNGKKEDVDLHEQLEELHAKLSEAKAHKDELVQEDTKEEETKEEDTTEDLQELIGELSEQLETMKAHLHELDEEKECCNCDECDKFDYEEFSILDDKIDEIQSTLTDIRETVNAIMDGIPHSFDKLTMDIMENEGSSKIKKKNAAKIIDTIEACAQKLKDHNVQLCTELKNIEFENQQRLNCINANLKLIANAKYGSSEDQKTEADMIKNIRDIRLVSEGNQQILGELYYKRLDKIDRGIDKIIEAINRVSANQYDRQDELEKKLDGLIDVVTSLAQKETVNSETPKPATRKTTKKTSTTKSTK